MRFKNFLIILSSYLFLVSPSVGMETIIFEDNFDAEPNVPWIYNYDSFANWDVTEGVVDLISSDHPGFEAFTVNGMFIDLDGSSPSLGAGRMETKDIFEFLPGYTYRLDFDLAGSQASWSPHPNTVSVSLGDIYNQDITLDTFEPFQTFQHVFDVTSPTSAKLIFDHWGHDQVGLLLDNVKITSTIKYDLIGREYFPGISIGATTFGARFAGQILNTDNESIGHFDTRLNHQGGPIEQCGATNTIVYFKLKMNFFDGRRIVLVMPYGDTATADWDWDDAACPYGGRECDFYSVENRVPCGSDVNPEVSLVAEVSNIPLSKRRFGSRGFDEISGGIVYGWLIHTPPIFPAVIGTFVGN